MNLPINSQNETAKMSAHEKSKILKNANRIVVIGSSCAGKTTFSKELAEALKLSHVELDSLNWEPNWKEASLENFKNKVAAALSSRQWVVDGSYSKVRDLIWPNAEVIIWLDIPLAIILKRFFLRSLTRSFKKEFLWSGNQETLRNSIFKKDSLLVWILKTHKRRRLQYLDYLKSSPQENVMMLNLK